MDVIEWAADLLVGMKTEKKKEKKRKKKSLAPAKTPTDGASKRSEVISKEVKGQFKGGQRSTECHQALKDKTK